MTIHQSKGLEYSKVYVSGLEENLFPSQMALADRSQLEEERRLFYVAITRAEQNLTLSFATSRFRFGNLLPCEPSRFIDEIDNEFLEFSKRVITKPQTKENSNTNFYRNKQEPSSLKRTISRQNKPKMIRPPATENFVHEQIHDISINMKVEHQRFGFGEIKKIEPLENPEKATIIFDDFGEKTLVLKFAKLRRV
jgi:DNA helicase-2/ATP-dependent DNA helicase PcrA